MLYAVYGAQRAPCLYIAKQDYKYLPWKCGIRSRNWWMKYTCWIHKNIHSTNIELAQIQWFVWFTLLFVIHRRKRFLKSFCFAYFSFFSYLKSTYAQYDCIIFWLYFIGAFIGKLGHFIATVSPYTKWYLIILGMFRITSNVFQSDDSYAFQIGCGYDFSCAFIECSMIPTAIDYIGASPIWLEQKQRLIFGRMWLFQTISIAKTL